MIDEDWHDQTPCSGSAAKRSNCEDAVGRMWLLSAAQPSESSAPDLWLCDPDLRRVCYLRVPAGPLGRVGTAQLVLLRIRCVARRPLTAVPHHPQIVCVSLRPHSAVAIPSVNPFAGLSQPESRTEWQRKPYNKKVKKCQFGHKTCSPRSTRTVLAASTATSAIGLPSGPIAYACSAVDAFSTRTVWPCRRRRSSSPFNSSRGIF